MGEGGRFVPVGLGTMRGMAGRFRSRCSREGGNPSLSVRSTVVVGPIRAARYDSYLRILAEG